MTAWRSSSLISGDDIGTLFFFELSIVVSFYIR
jgi:hypothetical protein